MPVNQNTDIEWALKSTYDKNEAAFEDKFWIDPKVVNLKFYQRKYITKQFPPALSVKLHIRVGIYTYEDLEVLCQPMNNYSDQVDAFKADTLENVDFHDDNAVFATNEVTGDISLDQDKYLLLTIPYSSGRTAYVDGEEQELLQANTMYMALKLDAGEHSIELRYHTLGLTVGLCISLVAFVVFILIFAFLERRDRMAVNKDRESLREGDEQ